jgi:hypothetical protein
MPARSDNLWWALGTVAGGVLLVVAGAVVIVCEGEPPEEFYVLILPTVVVAAPLVQVLAAGWERDPARPSGGVLDRLLALRRAHRLPPAGRASARRFGRWPGRRPVGPGADEAALDRLVQRKREWAGPPENHAG